MGYNKVEGVLENKMMQDHDEWLIAGSITYRYNDINGPKKCKKEFDFFSLPERLREQYDEACMAIAQHLEDQIAYKNVYRDAAQEAEQGRKEISK